MADQKKDKTPAEQAKEVIADQIFVTVLFDQKTGNLGIQSNTSNQIMQLGMIGMASALLSKPKQSPIMKPTLAQRMGLKTA